MQDLTPSPSPELDLGKAAMLLLTDYRAGPLGRISLETPITRQALFATRA